MIASHPSQRVRLIRDGENEFSRMIHCFVVTIRNDNRPLRKRVGSSRVVAGRDVLRRCFVVCVRVEVPVVVLSRRTVVRRRADRCWRVDVGDELRCRIAGRTVVLPPNPLSSDLERRVSARSGG